MGRKSFGFGWVLGSLVAVGSLSAACSNDEGGSSASEDVTGGGAGDAGTGGESSESGGSGSGGADGSGGEGTAGSGGDAMGGAAGSGNGSGGDGTGGTAAVCAPLADGLKVWLTMMVRMPPMNGEPPPPTTLIEDRLNRTDLDAGFQSLSASQAKVGMAVTFDGDLSLYRSGMETGLFYFDTVEFWLKTSSTNAGLVHFNDCFNSCDGEASQIFSKTMYDLRLVGGKLAWNFRDQDGGGPEADGSQGVVGTSNVADGTWHHVAAVIDKSEDTIALYVDGQLDLDSEPALDADLEAWPPNEIVQGETGPLTVGARREVNNPAPALQFLTGVIDELSFYETPLSKSDIQAIYNAGSLGKCEPE
jgi:hypothetical protein